MLEARDAEVVRRIELSIDRQTGYQILQGLVPNLEGIAFPDAPEI